jgi:hypothetical protein
VENTYEDVIKLTGLSVFSEKRSLLLLRSGSDRDKQMKRRKYHSIIACMYVHMYVHTYIPTYVYLPVSAVDEKQTFHGK